MSDFHCAPTAKNVCNHKFIPIPLFPNELSLNLVQKIKIKSLFTFVAEKQLFFIINYKRDNFYSVVGHFLARHVSEIGLPWQQLRSLVIKMYTKKRVTGCQ